MFVVINILKVFWRVNIELLRNSMIEDREESAIFPNS
jgi:hypothetical protein